MFGEKLASIKEQLENEKGKTEAKEKVVKSVSPGHLKDVPNITSSSPEKRRRTPVQKPVKTYPERTFDKFGRKLCSIRDQDIDILKAFCNEISETKRMLPTELRNNKRITDNVVIRLLIQVFSERLSEEMEDIDFERVQSEDELKYLIERMIGNTNH